MSRKFKPILFSTPMVEAIFESRKTQTRRLLKNSDHLSFKTMRTLRRVWDSTKEENPNPIKTEAVFKDEYEVELPFKAKYQTGDILWVRETFAKTTNINHRNDPHWPNRPHIVVDSDGSKVDSAYIYRADGSWNWVDDDGFDTERSFWKPSIFMPKSACRLFLEVTNVRVERLQDISEQDAWQEGCKKGEPTANGSFFPAEELQPDGWTNGWDCAEDWFADLWQDINGPESWDSNPWVWVYDFKKVEKPEDFS